MGKINTFMLPLIIFVAIAICVFGGMWLFANYPTVLGLLCLILYIGFASYTLAKTFKL